MKAKLRNGPSSSYDHNETLKSLCRSQLTCHVVRLLYPLAPPRGLQLASPLQTGEAPQDESLGLGSYALSLNYLGAIDGHESEATFQVAVAVVNHLDSFKSITRGEEAG